MPSICLRRTVLLFVVVSAGVGVWPAAAAADPLPSWRDGTAKRALVDFVARVTSPDDPDYVPPTARIAVFDNDGTLWCEQPFYTQLAFAVDRLNAVSAEHPDWQNTEPFMSALAGNLNKLAAGGEAAVLELVMATHAGMTTDQFDAVVRDWLRTARHPRFDRPYTQLVYQPMLEALAYLRANEFETYIVSGGGVDFMRPWTQRVYGIPPQRVVGSNLKMEYKIVDGEPALVRQPELNFVDDKAGKPVGIHRHIGVRPILAFGNSDGDYEMLQWTTAGDGARLGMIVRHTDAQREYAYDRQSICGRLDRALDDAEEMGWVVIDMAQEWKTVFPKP